MRNIIIGWVLATFHLGGFPKLYNLVASEVEQVFEDKNITSRKDKIALLSGDISPLADWVIEFHNNNPWNAWNLPLVPEE